MIRSLIRSPIRSGIRSLIGNTSTGLSSIAELFYNGEYGAWYAVSDMSALYQDSAGTTAVTSDGDPIGRIEDLSGNNVHLTQSTSASRPTYQANTESAFFDAVDDTLTATLSNPIAGTMLMDIGSAIVHAEIDVATTFSVNPQPQYPTADILNNLLIIDRVLPDNEVSLVKSKFGGDNNFSGVIEIFGLFRGRSDITNVHSENWDLSANTTLNSLFRDMSKLTHVGTANWDTNNVTTAFAFLAYSPLVTTIDMRSWVTSSCTSFGWFAREASALSTVLVHGGTGSPFSDSPCTNYTNAFVNTNLTQQSIDDILVAIETAGTSNGTFDQSGGSAPSATGSAAIDALRGRGWTIDVTGGY